MNGRGLSLMTMDMFSSRVPCGGKTLFKESAFEKYSSLVLIENVMCFVLSRKNYKDLQLTSFQRKFKYDCVVLSMLQSYKV